MPLGAGVKYRVKTNKGGSKVRLAFKGDKVVEVKPENGSAVKVSKKAKRGRKK